MARHKLIETNKVFKLYTQGKTMREIAQELEVSLPTVFYHVHKAKEDDRKETK